MFSKKIRSIGCSLLATVMALTLAGCGGGNDAPPLVTLPTGGGTPTNAPTQSSQTTGGGNEDLPNPVSESFTREQLAEAQIVIPAGSMVCDANGYLYSSIMDLQKSIKLNYNCELPIVEDTAPEKPYEILIGDTNREESYELFDELLLNDYAYALCSDKIVIRGGETMSLKKAIAAFHLDVSSYKTISSGYFYSTRMDTLIEETYLARDTKLNGHLLSSYSIVYPAQSDYYEKELAERLANRLQILTGRAIEWHDDSKAYVEGSCEILIGNTNRAFTPAAKTGAAIECAEHFVALVGFNAYDYGIAQKMLLNSILEPQIALENENIALPAQTVAAAPLSVSLMGYNINGTTGCLYQERIDNICRLVTKYLPDILVLQEPAENMMSKIHMEDYYGYCLGVPRHGSDVPALHPDWHGANSYGAVLYAKDRYEVLENGTKWMTPTPDEVSKLNHSEYYRIYTYVLFRDRLTSEQFIVINHHLDFNEEIQVTSMKYMFEFLNQAYTDVPVIMAGDFNAQANSVVVKDLITSDAGGFAFANRLAAVIDDNVTGSEIDFIFVTDCCVSVRKFTMCRDTYPDRVNAAFDHKYPSDHPATYAELVIDSKKECTHDWTAAKNFAYESRGG